MNRMNGRGCLEAAPPVLAWGEAPREIKPRVVGAVRAARLVAEGHLAQLVAEPLGNVGVLLIPKTLGEFAELTFRGIRIRLRVWLGLFSHSTNSLLTPRTSISNSIVSMGGAE